MIVAVGGGLITFEFAVLEIAEVVEGGVGDQKLRIFCIASKD